MTNQEAIKRIKEHITIHKYIESHAIHIVEALEMAISALQVQEVKPLDTINRQDAIDALERRKDKTAKGEIGSFYNTIIQHDIDAIIELPPAQPEIIHCRDCKHYYYADNRIPQEQRYVCDLDGDRWKPDDYCSYAERRTDGR